MIEENSTPAEEEITEENTRPDGYEPETKNEASDTDSAPTQPESQAPIMDHIRSTPTPPPIPPASREIKVDQKPQPEEPVPGDWVVNISGDDVLSKRVSEALGVLTGNVKPITPEKILQAQYDLYSFLLTFLTRRTPEQCREALNQVMTVISLYPKDGFGPRKCFRQVDALPTKGLNSAQIDEFTMIMRVLVDISTSFKRHEAAKGFNWPAVQEALTPRNGSAILTRLKDQFNV